MFLWQVYLDPGRNFNMSGVEFDAEERHQLIQVCKQEQRSAIQLLRMMGNQKVEILNSMKVQLQEKSLLFANYEQPDFILLKESILAFEKILQGYISSVGPTTGITDSDKRHLLQLLNVVGNNFGTKDMDWFCATETVLNCLFNLRHKFSQE